MHLFVVFDAVFLAKLWYLFFRLCSWTLPMHPSSVYGQASTPTLHPHRTYNFAGLVQEFLFTFSTHFNTLIILVIWLLLNPTYRALLLLQTDKCACRGDSTRRLNPMPLMSPAEYTNYIDDVQSWITLLRITLYSI